MNVSDRARSPVWLSYVPGISHPAAPLTLDAAATLVLMSEFGSDMHDSFDA